ncbi:hypothetical protein [Amycolatopsis aidingensis]|uniref:hypothetical protein n=1 Tax=Amycolatopsis aidingensis TaxID=2842453 RepID=UPI001C0B1999|nr:hypothetical protein [Amycolatopsis aidingensis]
MTTGIRPDFLRAARSAATLLRARVMELAGRSDDLAVSVEVVRALSRAELSLSPSPPAGAP